MAQKYQDSIPKRAVWSTNGVNKPLEYYDWGYNTSLVTFDFTGDVKLSVCYEGYHGYEEKESGDKWGNWFTLDPIRPTSYYKLYRQEVITKNTYRHIRTIGFSGVRVRPISVEGKGQIQVILSCNAGTL